MIALAWYVSAAPGVRPRWVLLVTATHVLYDTGAEKHYTCRVRTFNRWKAKTKAEIAGSQAMSKDAVLKSRSEVYDAALRQALADQAVKAATTQLTKAKEEYEAAGQALRAARSQADALEASVVAEEVKATRLEVGSAEASAKS